MSETIITLSVLGTVAVACIIGLIVITFREKEMKKKPTYEVLIYDTWIE